MSDSLPLEEAGLEAVGLEAAQGDVPGLVGSSEDPEGAFDEPVGEVDSVEYDIPERMCQMHFVDVVLVLPSTHPVLVLQEGEPPYREIRIPVGGAEGVAIAYAARQVHTPRPLTHELVTRIFEAFSLNLDQVRITRVEGRTFRGEIVLSGPMGSRTVDCRPSDAIALALRQRLPVPIMASPEVLDQVGGDSAGQN